MVTPLSGLDSIAVIAKLSAALATGWSIHVAMIKIGKLTKVEVLPGSFRVRRADVESVAAGKEQAV